MDAGSGEDLFITPKPTKLLSRILQLATTPDGNDIVLDFFGGSGTTGHAVFAANAMDNGQRRFDYSCSIPSQLAQSLIQQLPTWPKSAFEERAQGFKSDTALTAPNLDSGFRVLKIDTSNMRDVYYAPDALAQGDLLAQVDNIRPDRTPEDLLFQVLVDWGLDLALPIAQETIAGKVVFFVDGNALAACFDTGITRRTGQGGRQAQTAAGRLPRLQLRLRQRQDQRGPDLPALVAGHGGPVCLASGRGRSNHEIPIQSSGLPNRRS